MSDLAAVVCVLYRDSKHTTYDATYVAKLKSMLARHLPGQHRFVCYTNVDGVDCETIKLQRSWPGWWSKLEIMDPSHLPGRILYIDLDTVIIGDIEEMSKTVETTLIHGLHGERKPLGSGFMMLAEEDRSRLWQDFIRNPMSHMDAYRGDQEFIGPRVTNAHTWQDDFPKQLVSYKFGCRAKGDIIPNGARVICFHGKPRPHHMPEDHWIHRYWK